MCFAIVPVSHKFKIGARRAIDRGRFWQRTIMIIMVDNLGAGVKSYRPLAAIARGDLTSTIVGRDPFDIRSSLISISLA